MNEFRVTLTIGGKKRAIWVSADSEPMALLKAGNDLSKADARKVTEVTAVIETN